MIPKLLFDSLLDSIDLRVAITHSFRNYHALGLHYVCLHRDPRMTVKLYRFDGAAMNSCDFLVWPHNHAYAFEHWTLYGRIVHHRFRICEGDEWRLHDYQASERKPRALARVGLREVEAEVLCAGAHYALGTDDIHTISLEPEHQAACLQIQYHDVLDRTFMLSPAEEQPDCSDRRLYLPMNADFAHGTLSAVRKRMEASR